MTLLRRVCSARRAGAIALLIVLGSIAASLLANSARAHAIPEEALGHSRTEAMRILNLKESAANALPHTLGYAVTDVDSARAQLAAATGTEFAPVMRTTETVAFPALRTTQAVTFDQTRSVRGLTNVELVEAAPALGPFAAGRFAIPYVAYYVDSLSTAARPLAAAGMRLVASTKKWTFWEGREGVLIKLVEGTPPVGGINTPQAPIDLGPPPSLVWAPCDPVAFRTQLAAALGFEWRPQFLWTADWQLSDGTTHTLTAVNDISYPGPPFLTLETPHHATAEYGCDTHRHLHPVYVADDVIAAEAQMLNAGMPSIARVTGAVAYHLTDTGIFVEVAHRSFLEVIR